MKISVQRQMCMPMLETRKNYRSKAAVMRPLPGLPGGPPLREPARFLNGVRVHGREIGIEAIRVSGARDCGVVVMGGSSVHIGELVVTESPMALDALGDSRVRIGGGFHNPG